MVNMISCDDWKMYGKYAGPRRNKILVENSDILHLPVQHLQ
jgi:hypothetical protein